MISVGVLVYFKMLAYGTSPDKYTFPYVIKADDVLWNVILNGYLKHEDYGNVLLLFNEMRSSEIRPGRAATPGLWLQPWLVFGISSTSSGCVLLGWDDARSGRMVESENHLPRQPPQAHPGHGLVRAQFITFLMKRRIYP
nr:hypothetical protein [Tanacetum cinerariifolium]